MQLIAAIPKSIITTLSPHPEAMSDFVMYNINVTTLFSNTLLRIKDEAENRLIQEMKNAENKLLEEMKNAEGRLLKSKDEILQMNNKYRDVVEKLRGELKESNTKYLIARDKLNVRGALEFCRASFSKRTQLLQSVNVKDIDATLLKMYSEQPFHGKLLQAMKDNNLREEDVKRSFGGLYHAASKDQHGTNTSTTQVQIRQDSWANTEQFSLAAIFTDYTIAYKIVDKNDEEIKEGFDMSAFVNI